MKYFSGTGKFSSVYHLLSLIFFILISFVNLLGQTQSANSYTNPPYRFVHKIPFGNSYREITTSSSLCLNSDLSQGNFTGWFGCYGTWCSDSSQSSTNCQGAGEYSPYQPPCTNLNMPWYNTPTGGHFAIENVGTDPCISSLQKVFPGD